MILNISPEDIMRNKTKVAARQNNIVHLKAENREKLTERRKAPMATPSDLKPTAVKNISAALAVLLADTFAIYMKTKNFHWHMSGAHFRDYHLLLDEHGEQIFNMTDDMAERARKIGGT